MSELRWKFQRDAAYQARRQALLDEPAWAPPPLEPHRQLTEGMWQQAADRILALTCHREDAGPLVYAVRPRAGGLTKIGWALDPKDRLRRLQAMCPVALIVVDMVHGGGVEEAVFHHRFKLRRSHGEWFDLGDMADPLGACPL